MKRTFTIIAAASLVLCAACTKQESQSSELGGQTLNLTLEATRGEAVETKTAVSYNDEYASLESVWSAGDKIYVYSRKSGNCLGTLTQEGTILNQKASATAQYPTSYASFKGSVTLGAGDAPTDDFAFVYQGAGRTFTDNAVLTYEIGTSETVADLKKWDIAYATGKIQGTADAASCAVSFSNKLAFGYFSTEIEGVTGDLTITNYYNGFTFDVKTGNVAGVSAKLTIPSGKKFYMPLVPGSAVNMGTDKVWTEKAGKLGYANIGQLKSFTPSAGNYYRLGRNADVPFGPVKFAQCDWTCYETLKSSTFNVGTVEAPKNVHFTQGNLQYIGSAKNESGDAAPYWRIAETQFSYLGNSNYKPSAADAGTRMPENADTDLFGWGEVTPSGNTADSKGNTGFLCSNVNSDYQQSIAAANIELPAEANWATKFNNGTKLYIEQGKEYSGIAGDIYYCLTKTEWTNLFANQYWCGATVTLKDGTTKVKGIVVCPSSIETLEAAQAIIGNNAGTGSHTPTGLFDECALDQATVDENGLLFLPAAGYRRGTSVSNVGSGGVYWSTTSSGATTASNVFSGATNFFSACSYNRYDGVSVRLASVANPV